MEQNDKVFAKAMPLSPAGTAGSGGRASLREDETDAPAPRTNDAPTTVEADVGSTLLSEQPDAGLEDERKGSGKPPKKASNNVRKIRIERMMSKAELARRANLSVLTIDRVERGYGCRMDTKRKILEALGLSLADRVRVFGEEE